MSTWTDNSLIIDGPGRLINRCRSTKLSRAAAGYGNPPLNRSDNVELQVIRNVVLRAREEERGVLCSSS